MAEEQQGADQRSHLPGQGPPYRALRLREPGQAPQGGHGGRPLRAGGVCEEERPVPGDPEKGEFQGPGGEAFQHGHGGGFPGEPEPCPGEYLALPEPLLRPEGSGRLPGLPGECDRQRPVLFRAVRLRSVRKTGPVPAAGAGHRAGRQGAFRGRGGAEPRPEEERNLRGPQSTADPGGELLRQAVQPYQGDTDELLFGEALTCADKPKSKNEK